MSKNYITRKELYDKIKNDVSIYYQEQNISTKVETIKSINAIDLSDTPLMIKASFEANNVKNCELFKVLNGSEYYNYNGFLAEIDKSRIYVRSVLGGTGFGVAYDVDILDNNEIIILLDYKNNIGTVTVNGKRFEINNNLRFNIIVDEVILGTDYMYYEEAILKSIIISEPIELNEYVTKKEIIEAGAEVNGNYKDADYVINDDVIFNETGGNNNNKDYIIEDGLLLYFPLNSEHTNKPTKGILKDGVEMKTNGSVTYTDDYATFSRKGNIETSSINWDFYSQLTMMCKVNRTSRYSGDHETLILLGYGSGKECGLYASRNGDNKPSCFCYGKGSVANDGSALPLNEWDTLVGVIDKTNNKLMLWVNGVKYENANAALPTLAAYMSIGGYKTSYQINGFIKDVAIYNRVLSDKEILAYTNEETLGGNDNLLDTTDILIGNIVMVNRGNGYGYYSGGSGSFTTISNTSKVDGLHALTIDNKDKNGFTINAHIRRLAPDTYNRLQFVFYDDNGNVENVFTGSIAYSSSDFNGCDVEEDGLVEYISNNLNKTKKIEIRFGKV